MRKLLLVPVLFLLGIGAAWATHESTTEEHVWSTVVTLSGTITDVDPLPHPVTVTETQTVTVTTTTTGTEPPPPPNACSDLLVPGGDLSTFLSGLSSGDVGCLRQGSYSDGEIVSWSVPGATLMSYPGESAEIVGTQLQLVGNGLTVKQLTIRETPYDRSCIGVNGDDVLIEQTTLTRCSRHGIILHTDAVRATVNRNIVHDVGYASSLSGNQAHGIYVQGPGHRVTRNVFSAHGGYGIHVYASPSNLLVSGNTTLASVNRYGIVVRTTGSGVTVVNNLFADGGALHSCGGCLIDKNLVRNGWTIQNGSSLGATNTLTSDPLLAANHKPMPGSPAIDAARNDAVFPDLAGAATFSGSAPDLGAYEH